MPGELDDILLAVECPRCGATASAPWGNVRILGAIGCPCGALIAIEDDTPLAAVQRLIDEANPPNGDNDR